MSGDDSSLRKGIHNLVDVQDLTKLTDASLESSDGVVFRVSKLAMASASQYFSALFCNRLASDVDVSTTKIPDINSDSLEILVDFAHGHLMKDIITKYDIFNIINVMDRFNVSEAIHAVEATMLDSLSMSNVLSYLRITQQFFLPKIERTCKDLLLHHFLSIPNQTLMSLSAEELKDLLSDDRLNVKREEDIYYSIIKWINGSSERMEHLPLLVKLVRFGNSAVGFIDSELLKELSPVLQFPTLVQYLRKVDAVLKDIQADPTPEKFNVKKYKFLRPRIPYEIAFVFGGWGSHSATRILETYDSRVNKWYEVDVKPDDTITRAYHGMVYFKGLIYMIGGFDGHTQFSSVCAFDPITMNWSDKGFMSNARCYVACAVLGDFIYACGGFDGVDRMNSVERYDAASNQWSMIPNMHFIRSDASASALNGKLYVVGGFDGTSVSSSVEYFDPKLFRWTVIENMTSPRSGVQSTAHSDGFLYVFGGNSGNNRETTGERYDPISKTWTVLSQMKIARSNFALLSMEGLLYIIGGFDGNTTIDCVESYDPVKKTWCDMWRLSVSRRSALAACVVPGLPNGKQYSWLRRELLDEETEQELSSAVHEAMEVTDEEVSPVATRTRRRRRLSRG